MGASVSIAITVSGYNTCWSSVGDTHVLRPELGFDQGAKEGDSTVVEETVRGHSNIVC